MIQINWKNDQRNQAVEKYLVGAKHPESRLKAFLGGWTRQLNENWPRTLNEVTWVGLGMVYGGILGDINVEQRKAIYALLLSQYLASERMNHLSEEQRTDILRLVNDSLTAISGA